MNSTQTIKLLVKKYPWPDSEELFRSELEWLVAIAQKEAVQEMKEKLLK